MSHLPEKTDNTTNETLQANALPLRLIDRLFDRFTATYGNRFIDMWESVDHDKLKQAWAEDLAGLSLEELKYGVDLLKTKKYPPTLPDFFEMCRPKIDYEDLFIRAANNHRETKLIYWSANKFGFYDLQRTTYKIAEQRWKSCVDEMMKCELKDIPEPVANKLLPAPGETTPTAEKIKKEAGSLIKNMNLNKNEKAWAKKILENPKNYPDISILFAKQSIGKI